MTPRQNISLPLRFGKPLLVLASLNIAFGCHSLGQRTASSDIKYPAVRSVAAVDSERMRDVQTVAFTEPKKVVATDSDDAGGQADFLVERFATEAATASGPTSLRAAMAQYRVDELQVTAVPPEPYVDLVEQPTGMTLEMVESIALGSHPAVAEARARLQSTRGQYDQAGLPFNPVLQYQSEEMGNEESSGLHSVRLSQQIVTANKLGIAQQVQAREIEKQRARLRIAELTVLARVRASFARSLVAQERSQIAGSIVQLAEESVSSVTSLFEAEEVSRISVLQAKVELEQASIAAENAETIYQASLRSLAAAVGNMVLPQGPLIGNLEATLVERPWEPLFAELAQMSPEVSLAGSELQRAKWSLQLACAQVVPNVTVQAGAGYDASTDDTFGVFGVSVPLPIRNRNQGNIRSARADVSAASAAIERTELDLQGRLADAAGRYEVARTRYVRLKQSVIPNAEETFELSRQAFDAGESDYLQLLTAQRTLFNTQLAVLDAIGTASQTAAEIDAMVVRLSF